MSKCKSVATKSLHQSGRYAAHGSYPATRSSIKVSDPRLAFPKHVLGLPLTALTYARMIFVGDGNNARAGLRS